ncbi:MAG: hypothetical protein H7096_12785 [Flavobacterium sp.]|nr:hypothetical protein [Pedobacter sp.]
MLRRSIIGTFIFCFTSFLVSAHKYYTSITQVEYNVTTQSAEVIMNVFSDDLLLAISNQNKRVVKMTDKDFTTLTYHYLDSRFAIKDTKNHQLKNEYVGLEVNRDMVSIYFEIRSVRELDMVSIKQISLLETNKEQTNIVNLRSGKQKTSMVFNAGNPGMQTVKFDQ